MQTTYYTMSESKQHDSCRPGLPHISCVHHVSCYITEVCITFTLVSNQFTVMVSSLLLFLPDPFCYELKTCHSNAGPLI